MDSGLSSALGGAAAAGAAMYLDAKLGFSSDLKNLRREKSLHKRLGRRIQELGNTPTMYAMFEKIDPTFDAIWFEGRNWSYRETKIWVDRFAALLESKGLKKGDTVAVFTTNSPEMLITILALSKLGIIAGLINTNLREEALRHCLVTSTATTIISTPDISDHIPQNFTHYALDLGSFSSKTPSSQSVIFLKSPDLPGPNVFSPPATATLATVAVLIFTSGTTGKAKACGIRNMTTVITSTPSSIDVGSPQTYYPLRTYSPLPLFHGTAFFSCLCSSLGSGSTMCIARKFSTSRFFRDVHDSRATRILYVGELCRYLVNSPPTSYDRNHNCIVATGNGLRAEIWENFKTRFGIPEIREFYRSTEGLARYDNVSRGAVGAGKVGFMGSLCRLLENDTLVIKVNPETKEPYRNPKTGFCIRAGLNEPGEAIGRIRSRELLTEYVGNLEATEQKILRDVFVKGDAWQRAGDLLVVDGSGWIRFHDRMGDTFRWKGENVSAGEVRDHIAKLNGVIDAVVYGVKLDSYDGQAGAAAITLSSPPPTATEFMASLHGSLTKTGLPAYAMPRLVRITRKIEANATFKKAKMELVKKSWRQGDGNDDQLFWLDGKTYRVLDEEAWRSVEIGKAKL